MNPNHFLAAAIFYLFTQRPGWRATPQSARPWSAAAIIDRVAAKIGRALVEVPVGFKWFVPGLLDGSLGFGGEESAGASFLRRDGTVWVTDKDGIIMDLLAVEMMARTGRDPSELYSDLTRRARRLGVRAHRCAGHCGTEDGSSRAVAAGRQRLRAGRRSD